MEVVTAELILKINKLMKANSTQAPSRIYKYYVQLTRIPQARVRNLLPVQETRKIL
jgi:hypothetical protein